MNQFIRLCVRNPVFVNILMWMILFSGGYAWFTLSREVLPEFSIDTIQIQVPYPGADPAEVEEGICLKIEEAIKGLEGIKKYTTHASEHIGSALIEARADYDTQKLKDEITDQINAVTTFPVDAERPIIRELTTRGQVLMIALFGDLPEKQLKELAEDIKDDLVRTQTISQVSISGSRRYEIAIEFSEERLRQYGLTFNDVSRTIRQASQNFPGGTVRSSAEQFTIRTMGRRYTGREFADIIVIAGEDGTSIRLDRVARIRDGFIEDELVSRFNGKPCVQINVFKTHDEDALAIKKDVTSYIQKKNKTLPDPVRLEIWADTSRYINARLYLLLKNGALGLCLVFLLLWLFLDLRLAFWCSMGIPISLAGALALMITQDQTINMISMFALIMILGIIVDDAIIVGEAVYVHRKRGLKPEDAAIEGGKEVSGPVFAAVVTSIMAFTPLIFVGGVMGKFISVLPIVVIAALVVSLVESIFMLPAHLRDLPDLKRKNPEAGRFQKLVKLRNFFSHGLEDMTDRYYRPFLEWALRWRYAAFACAVMILVLAIGYQKGGYLQFNLFPQTDTDFIYARVEFPSGTPVEITKRAVEQLENGIRKVEMEISQDRPLVTSIFSVSGGQSGFQIAGSPNQGEAFVELTPSEDRGIHFEEIMARWEKATGPITGASAVTFKNPDHGPGGKGIEFWLMGRDTPQILAAAKLIKDDLKTFEGVYQIQDDYRPGKRELRARLKPEARNLGLTQADLGRQLRQGFYGDETLRIQRGRDDIRVYVRYPVDERRSMADIEKIRIRTPAGEEVPLYSVADLRMEDGYSTIHRKDGLRRVVVGAEVNPDTANSKEIMDHFFQTKIPELKDKYPGLIITAEGQKRETSDSFGSLKLGFPLAMLGIFLTLATMFRSYIQPLVIMVTIPFGLIGAIAGHIVMGFRFESFNLSMMSMFGMVALSGIVVNDAIVLIECFNSRLREGKNIESALILAGLRRFRAIVLTTLTTSFGLAPLIIEKSVQAQFLIPMVVSIAFGVAFASMLTLILIPCLILILNDFRRGIHWIQKGILPAREEVEPAFLYRAEGCSS
jgi:multidrug efflux pump subunit AcrB